MKRLVASSMRLFAASAMGCVLARGARGCGAHDARGSDLVPLQELAPDHHALDLGGALADQQKRRVAVQALYLELLRVAVAAVDAQRLLDAEAACLGREQLGHPRLEVRALARVLQARRAQGQQARGLDLRGHVGELELARLVLGDRLAERLTLL